jgi:hypothetical protein
MKTKLAIILISLIALAGCVEEPRPAPSSTRMIEGAGPQPPIVQQLAEVPLATQADFDDLEERLRQRVAPARLVELYAKLAERARPGSDKRDALLLQRLALVHLKAGAESGGFQKAFTIADRLRNEAPDSPHTHYLLSAITALLVPPNPDGSYRLNPQRMDVAKRLQQHWRKLLAVDPAYEGPRGLNAARIKRGLKLLDAAVERQGAEPTQVDPAPAITESATPETFDAHRKLSRLEKGDLAARRTLCGELMDDKAAEPTSDVERWLRLSCAAELKDSANGVPVLAALIRSSAISEPCRWIRELGVDTSALPDRLQSAMQARDVPPCPPTP